MSSFQTNATKTFAISLGLNYDEWDLIREIFVRTPNQLETLVFQHYWQEKYSAKRTQSLISRLHRGACEKSNAIPYHRWAGAVPIDEHKSLVMRIVSHSRPEQYGLHCSTQHVLEQALEDVMAEGASVMGLASFCFLGASERSDTAEDLREHLDSSTEFSHWTSEPMVERALGFYSGFESEPYLSGFAIGIVDKEGAVDVTQKPCHGDLLIYIGQATTRTEGTDFTQTAENKDNNAQLDVGKIQPNNPDSFPRPQIESKLLRVCEELREIGKLKAAYPLGQRSLALSMFDLSLISRASVLLELDRVPISEDGLSADDIILSETPQRLLLVIDEEAAPSLRQILKKWNLSSSVVGKISQSDNIEATWNHRKVFSASREHALTLKPGKTYSLVQYPPMVKPVTKIKNRAAMQKFPGNNLNSISQSEDQPERFDEPEYLGDVWVDLIGSGNLCSRSRVFDSSDREMGLRWLKHSSDCSLAPLNGRDLSGGLKDTPVPGIALTLAANPLYTAQDSYLGTVLVLAGALRRLAAVGATPLAGVSSFHFGNPENYKHLCSLAEATRALPDAGRFWNVPQISDWINLELSAEDSGRPGTPIIAIVGKVENLRNSPPSAFQNEGDTILLLGESRNEISCSDYTYYCHQTFGRHLPDINFETEERTSALVRRLSIEGRLCSAHAICSGGIGVALAECCLMRKRPIGAELFLALTLGPRDYRADAVLFSETPSRFILSCKHEQEETVRALCKEYAVPVTGRGKVGGKGISVDGALNCRIPLSTAYRVWSQRMSTMLQKPLG